MKKSPKLSLGDSKKLADLFKDKVKKILLTLGKDAFLFILLFVLLDIFLGEILFYKYITSLQFQEPEMQQAPIKFKEDAYQSVLKKWHERNSIFESSSSKNYLDPFQES